MKNLAKLLLGLLLLAAIPLHAQSPGPTAITGNQCLSLNLLLSSPLVITVSGAWSGTLQPQVAGILPQNATVTPLGGSVTQPNITGNGIYTTTVTAPQMFQVCGQGISGSATLTFTPPQPTSTSGVITGVQCSVLDVYITGLVSITVSGSWSGTIQPEIYIGPSQLASVIPIGLSTPLNAIINNGTYTTFLTSPNVLQLCGAPIIGNATISMAS